MRTYAQKQKPSPQSKFVGSKSENQVREFFPQNHAVRSIFHLQRTIGNRAVLRLLQANTKELKKTSAATVSNRFAHDFNQIPVPASASNNIQLKLKINAPRDIYEQEADRVANQMLQQEIPGDRKDNKVEIQARPSQRAKKGEYDINEDLQNRLNRSKGSGSPLSDEVRAFFKPRVQHDFSNVMVHTDNEAAQINRELGARAFTYDRNIYFGAGQYNPQSMKGKWLLAHELTHVVQQEKGNSDRLMRDFRRTSPADDTLEVITTLVEPGGSVRFRAAPRIISTDGDRVPYRVLATVTNRPFDVFIGIRRIATGEVIHQRSLIRDPSHRHLRRWQGEGTFHIPPFSASLTLGSGVEFYVRLEPSGAEPVEYSIPLSLDLDRSVVELSRVLHAEGGGSLIGMVAVAHVIQNRLDTGFPPGQIDAANPWPTNFINTGYFLNRRRPRGSWPRETSAASRSLARIIIRNERTTGTDPTFGARFYRSASTPGLERTNPTFIQLSERVRRGILRRVTVGGNVFYAPR